MQHQLKNYLKLGILLFGISLSIIACQKEDDLRATSLQDSKNVIEVNRITLSQIPDVRDFLANKTKSINLGKSTTINGATFDNDNIL